MARKLVAAVLAGGRGERLWPLSTRALPKQFMRLGGDETLIELAVRRASAVAEGTVTVVTAETASAAREALPGATLLVEPRARNTALACCLANDWARDAGADALLVLPADHLVRDTDAFASAVRVAERVAEGDYLVTFGVRPDRPETGYGYVEPGAPLGDGAFVAAKFHEKPDEGTAKRYIERGFLWNSGMFLWRCEAFSAALAEAGFEPPPDLLDEGVRKRVYAERESISVDYALMERARRVATVRGAFDWDDVGSLLALRRVFPPDDEGNTLVGDTLCTDGGGNTLVAEGGAVVVAGVRGLVVVHTPRATLVVREELYGDLKSLLGELRKDERLKNYL